MTPAGKPQWRGVSGVPGLGLSVPFSLDTSGSVLNLWEEEKRPRNFWRSIKLWKGWGKDKERSGQEADNGQHHIGGHQARGNQIEAEVGHVGEFRPGLASHSCRHGKLLQRKQKEHNIQVGELTTAPGRHRPVRPLLSLPANWHNQSPTGGIRSSSVATQTSPQVASHKRLQRSSASSGQILVPPTMSNDLHAARNNLNGVEAQKPSEIHSSMPSTNLVSPKSELRSLPLLPADQSHPVLKRESSGKPISAVLQRFSSDVPPPLPPRVSLCHLPSLPPACPAAHPPSLPPGHPRMPSSQHAAVGQRLSETHPRLARLSSSHQPRIFSPTSMQGDGRDGIGGGGGGGGGGEESSDLGGSLSSTGSGQSEVPFRCRQDSLYSMGFSDICSPLTEVEPDYSTDNSDDDDDEDERVRDGGEVGHDAENIYEQVLNCRRPSFQLQLPPLPLPPSSHQPPRKPSCPTSTPSKMKQEVGEVKMWAQGGEVVEEEKINPGLRWKARQLKESLSAKFSSRVFQIRN